MDDSINTEVYKVGELERPVAYGEQARQLKVDKDLEKKLTTVDIKSPVHRTLAATGVIKKVGKGKDAHWVVTESGKKTLKQLEGLEKFPVGQTGTKKRDATGVAAALGTGDKSRFKKAMIIHAAATAASGREGSEAALDFLDRHIGYEQDENGQYPAGSIKRFQNDCIQALVDPKNPEAKKNMLEALSEKLPLQALMTPGPDGEKMVIDGLTADSEILGTMFGVDSFEELTTGLDIEEDENGDKYLVYSSEGPPANTVRIATTLVRQKGQGYASSVGLEFAIADEFILELDHINTELREKEPPPDYRPGEPPRPDPVSPKERAKLERMRKRLEKDPDSQDQIQSDSIRPLLRSLIVRELDRIKNGN